MYNFFSDHKIKAVNGLNLLTINDFRDIHLATLQVLKKTGVFVEDQRAREVFGSCGVRVDEKNMIVKLPSPMVEDAIESAKVGLSKDQSNIPENNINCASDVVRRLGGTEEEKAMVAGFAGGMALSGNGCGALGATIWKKSLEWVKQNPGKSAFNNKASKSLLKPFLKETKGELVCSQICGRTFGTLQDHSEFLKNGGCSKLIETLAN